jgi:hypothetical protein
MDRKLAKGIHPNCDCADIAEDLLKAANGQGKIIRITAKEGAPHTLIGDVAAAPVRVSEGGQIKDFAYHEVYTDGKYVFDPRMSSQPIPLGDWYTSINKLNPTGVKYEKK